MRKLILGLLLLLITVGLSAQSTFKSGIQVGKTGVGDRVKIDSITAPDDTIKFWKGATQLILTGGGGVGDLMKADSATYVGGYHSYYDGIIGLALKLNKADSVNYPSGYMSRYDGVTGDAGKLNKADSNTVAGGYVTHTHMDDAVVALTDTVSAETIFPLQSDSTWTIDFPFGSGQTGDTILFQDNAIAGVHHWGYGDTIIIRKAIGVLAEGSGTETISIQLSSDVNFKDGSPTNLFGSAQVITSTTSGTVLTTFTNPTILPTQWSWLVLSGVSAGNRPTMLGLTFYYSIQNRSY